MPKVCLLREAVVGMLLEGWHSSPRPDVRIIRLSAPIHRRQLASETLPIGFVVATRGPEEGRQAEAVLKRNPSHAVGQMVGPIPTQEFS